MTKAGDKILAGLRQALAAVRGDPDAISKIKVTPSCGCVFCDMNLWPNLSGLHHTSKGSVKCTRAKP